MRPQVRFNRAEASCPPPLASVAPDPTSETISLTVTDTAYGSMSGNSNQALSPYIRKYRVEGTASIAITKRVPEASNPTPNPIEARHTLGIRVAGNSIRFPDQANPAKMYVAVNGNQTIWQAYAGGGTQPNQSGTRADGTPWWCGPSYGSYCYSYSGSGSVSITPLQGDIHLSVDSSTVSIGSSVRFTLTADSAEGQSLPIQVDSAKWTPSASSDGGEASEKSDLVACTFSGAPLQCTRQVLGSGTLTVIAHVSGFRRTATQAVAVREGHIVLVASKTAVQNGDSVSFTASWSDGAPMQIDKWSFIPDPNQGTDITFGCPAYQNPCKRAVKQSGHMKVQAVRNNKFRTAQVHVNVAICLTGDDRLDDNDVRAGFADMMRRSNPDSAPGAGIDSTRWETTGWRKERALWIVRRADGDYYTVPADLVSTSECSNLIDWAQYQRILATLQPGDRIVGVAHSHPAKPGEKTFGDCSAKDPITGKSVPGARWPGDTAGGRQQMYAGSDSTNGGGSDADWAVAGNGTDVYIMNRTSDPSDPTIEGETWRLPGDMDAADHKLDADTPGRRKPWKRSCDWK